MITNKCSKILVVCMFLCGLFFGCKTQYNYIRFNTEPNLPSENIAFLACDSEYANINDPLISLMNLSAQRINDKVFIPSSLRSGMGFRDTGWSGIIELIPGKYEICTDLRFKSFESGYYYNTNECQTAIVNAQAGHTYVVSPVIDLEKNSWYPIISDITQDTSSVKQWIDDRVAVEFRANNQSNPNHNHQSVKSAVIAPDAASMGKNSSEKATSPSINVKNVSRPGQKPKSGDFLLATQMLDDGSTFEIKFPYDPTQRHKRVYGSSLSFSEYVVFYSKDGQMVNSIYKYVNGKTKNGSVFGLQKVGSHELVVYDMSPSRKAKACYIQGKDGIYTQTENRDIKLGS